MTLLMLLLSSALPDASAQDCPRTVDVVRELGRALNEVRLEDAAALARSGSDSLTCQSEVISPLTLTSLFQTSGAVYMFLGDETTAELSFGRAVSVSATARIDPILGEQAADLYEDVLSRASIAVGGTLTAEPGVQAWVDGRAMTPGRDHEMTAGVHLIQYREEGRLYGKLVRVAPGDARNLGPNGRVGPLQSRVTAAPVAVVAAPPPVVTPSPPPPPAHVPVTPAPAAAPSAAPSAAPTADRNPRWGLVTSGVVGLALGGASFYFAAASHEQFETSNDPFELEALQLRTNAAAVLGVSCLALGGSLVGVGLTHSGGWVGTQVVW